MADLIQITSFSDEYNDNLLSGASLLQTNPTPFSDYDGVADLSDIFTYTDKAKSLSFSFLQNVMSGVNESFGVTDSFKKVVKNDGFYIFSFRTRIYSLSAPSDYAINLSLKVKINGSLAYTFTNELVLETINSDNYYTFAQTFECSADDEIDFYFDIQSDSIGAPNPSATLKFSGFKLEFDDRNIGLPTRFLLPFENKIGNYDYNNTLTAQSFTGTDIKLLNNGLGVNTNKLYPLDGIVDLFNTTTNEFDFSKMSLGDLLGFRIDASVTTTGANQNIDFYLKVGVGSGSEYNIKLGSKFIKTAGAHDINDIFNEVYIGNTITKDYPVDIYFTSDANATVLLNGFLVIGHKRF